MSGLIDLNTASNEEETPSPSASPSSTAVSSESSSAAVSMELWHACAGPLISLPKKGTAVVCFPQGLLEQLPEHPAVAYDLPPHVFCRVVDVKLHADAANDEVYAQVSLVPDQKIEQQWKEGICEAEAADEDAEIANKSMTSHMFCKTLTASDTSTHGGFSVPRRAAEDCFPPLDYTQQRPSQEIVASDLHGIKWKFRHIYRGQPRRHLLTTGWSAFVNKKKLVPRDAVLFLRGSDGELRLGIRRAAQVKTGTISNNQRFNVGCIAALVNAISLLKKFDLCYNPRVHSFDIIVPYGKFTKSLARSFSSGTRFKICSETEDSSERSGLIVGVSDADPVRWPGSKWKCLLVKWDAKTNRIGRISPWEIESSLSCESESNVTPGPKRSRVCFPATETDPHVPTPHGKEVSDPREPSRFQKVLQGQEVFRFTQPLIRHQSCITPTPHLNGSRIYGVDSHIKHVNTGHFSRNCLMPQSSLPFPKSSKGQETAAILPYRRCPFAFQTESDATYVLKGVQVPIHGIPLTPASAVARKSNEEYSSDECSQMAFSANHLPSKPLFTAKQNFMTGCDINSSRLFGFPLTEGVSLSRPVAAPKLSGGQTGSSIRHRH